MRLTMAELDRNFLLVIFNRLIYILNANEILFMHSVKSRSTRFTKAFNIKYSHMPVLMFS